MVETNLKLAKIRISGIKVSNGKVVLDDTLDNWSEIQRAISDNSIFTAFVENMLDIRQLVSSGSIFPSTGQITLALADGGTGLNIASAVVVINYLTSK